LTLPASRPIPPKKEALLLRALEWTKLAYSGTEDEFQRLLEAMNGGQMSGRVQRQPMQQQQQQQQQKDDDK
jgi:hypothetical protein